mgnify:CR=1 FL=1
MTAMKEKEEHATVKSPRPGLPQEVGFMNPQNVKTDERTREGRDAVHAYTGLYPPPPKFKSNLRRPSAGEAGLTPVVKRRTIPVGDPNPAGEGFPAKLPEAENWAKAIAAASVDVVARRRDPRSLRRWLTPAAFELLLAQPPPRSPSKGSPARPVTARVFRVDERTAEFAVTVWDGEQLRAVAGRLEKLRQRWLTTALQVG